MPFIIMFKTEAGEPIANQNNPTEAQTRQLLKLQVYDLVELNGVGFRVIGISPKFASAKHLGLEQPVTVMEFTVEPASDPPKNSFL